MKAQDVVDFLLECDDPSSARVRRKCQRRYAGTSKCPGCGAEAEAAPPPKGMLMPTTGGTIFPIAGGGMG